MSNIRETVGDNNIAMVTHCERSKKTERGKFVHSVPIGEMWKDNIDIK